jgi:hypothetical protein
MAMTDELNHFFPIAFIGVGIIGVTIIGMLSSANNLLRGVNYNLSVPMPTTSSSSSRSTKPSTLSSAART